MQASMQNINTPLLKSSQATLARFGLSEGTVFRSYLDVLMELEAENYTIRIAASRSFWIYGLEVLNLERFMKGSGEVYWNRKVFWAFSGRNLWVGGWDFVRIEISTRSIDPYGCWELIPSKLLIFGPNKGQIFHKFLARAVWDPRL